MSNVVPLHASSDAQSGSPVKTSPEEFILPSNLTEMTPDQVDQLVANARVLRFQRVEQVTRAKKTRQAALNSGSLKKYDMLIGRQVKLIEKLDKLITDLEKTSRDIRAAQIMLGDDV